MSSRMFGNWSPFDFTLTPQAKDAFETALPAMFGAAYAPFAFASRGAAGTHYCFLCEVQHAAALPDGNVVKVYIHQPTDSAPYHYRIVPVSP
ncbi:MAG: hypothetical protein WAZ48_00235 [Lysobacteraceae bacterium]